MTGQAAQSPTPIRDAFNPTQYLTRVNGAEYLKVEHRLAWLRAEHPDAVLTTDLVEILPNIAIFRAEVRLPSGGCATGYGSESPADFRDYLEKAETKAIGRALAALGFGTQFVPDHEDGSSHGRPVDAPVPIRPRDRPPQQRANSGNPRPAPERTAPEREPAAANPPASPAEQPGGHDPMTERQRRYLEVKAHDAGMDLNELNDLAQQRFGCCYQWLSRPNASALITELQQRAS